MRFRHIAVTQEDLANGQPSSTDNCPIALALKRNFPGCQAVEVDSATELITAEGDVLQGYLPRNAEDFMLDFDNLRDVQPFEFDLELVNPDTEEDKDE